MHDVLDLCDTVPDEAEELLHSGHAVGLLLDAARAAAARRDLQALEAIRAGLAAVPCDPSWPWDEPDDDASLQAILAAAPRLCVDAERYRARLHGAWLGRCVGNTMGKPVEGLRRDEVETYLRAAGQWPQTGYVPFLDPLPLGVSHLHESAPFASAGLFDEVPRDDDIDWTILNLQLLEEHGQALTTGDVARAWLDRLPFTQTFTAERVAYRNLLRGVPPEEAAAHENPYREWIGALIRGDVFGYVRPGDPGAAARLALVDARLSHQGNGVYGELWAAALLAAAFGASTAPEALRAALGCVPGNSRLAASQREVLALHGSGATATGALDWVGRELGHHNWVHTLPNAALIAVGLLWGRDFTTAVATTIAGGLDTDSNAATVGSAWGALHGAESVPKALVGTTHHRVRSAVRGFDRVPVADLVERTARLAVLPVVDPIGKPSRARPIPVVIDTDPGLGEPGSDVDDGFAIALALRSPELDVRGLTVVNGNVDAPTGYAVAHRLRERLGRPDLPVRLGATRPLRRDMATVHALFEAVLDADPSLARPRARPLPPPPGEEDAADFLVREAARVPGKLVVIAIGPMTNLALALDRDPAFATNVGEFVVMAGSATTYAQNVTVVGDFNAFVDPEALDRLLRSGARVRMVGLDQTAQCLFTRADAAAMRATGDPFGAWAADCSDAWIDFLARAFPGRPEHRTGFFLHDPLVIAAVIDPAVCTWEAAAVEVELASDLARGLVVADRGLALKPRGPANATVATATDVARFRRLFLDRISRAPKEADPPDPTQPGGEP